MKKSCVTFSSPAQNKVEMLHVIILALAKETNALTTCHLYFKYKAILSKTRNNEYMIVSNILTFKHNL